MKQIDIQTAGITDEDSFFEEFEKKCRFPSYSGRNFNAWIDCMGTLDTQCDLDIEEDESVTLVVHDAEVFAERCKELWLTFLTCTSIVNQRHAERVSLQRILLELR